MHLLSTTSSSSCAALDFCTKTSCENSCLPRICSNVFFPLHAKSFMYNFLRANILSVNSWLCLPYTLMLSTLSIRTLVCQILSIKPYLSWDVHLCDTITLNMIVVVCAHFMCLQEPFVHARVIYHLLDITLRMILRKSWCW